VKDRNLVSLKDTLTPAGTISDAAKRFLDVAKQFFSCHKNFSFQQDFFCKQNKEKNFMLRERFLRQERTVLSLYQENIFLASENTE